MRKRIMEMPEAAEAVEGQDQMLQAREELAITTLLSLAETDTPVRMPVQAAELAQTTPVVDMVKMPPPLTRETAVRVTPVASMDRCMEEEAGEAWVWTAAVAHPAPEAPEVAAMLETS